MHAELLMIGTELLLGQVVDSNAARMAQNLAAHGVPLYQKTTVGDNPGRILDALRGALGRADVVLCSGGLGPTEDDITRECVAEYAGVPLVYHPELWDRLSAWYLARRRTIPENNRRQAMLPEGALALDNPLGTAPGFIIEVQRPSGAGVGYVACMPGVPHELDAMLENQVLPFLKGRFNLRQVVHSRVLKVCGLGESRVDSLIGDLILKQENPTIGLVASPDVTRIRVSARADDTAAALALIAPIEAAIRERLQGHVMGADEDTLESVVDALLRARGWRLAVAEEASGGQIAQRLCAAAASQFAGGRVFPPAVAPPEVREKAIDLARQLLLEFESKCSLVLLSALQTDEAYGRFECPDGTLEWTSRGHGRTARNQLRHAIIALEKVRCFLSGVPSTSELG